MSVFFVNFTEVPAIDLAFNLDTILTLSFCLAEKMRVSMIRPLFSESIFELTLYPLVVPNGTLERPSSVVLNFVSLSSSSEQTLLHV